MLRTLFEFLANSVTPASHIPWRWEAKNFFLRRMGIRVGHGVVVGKCFEFLSGSKLILEDYAVIGRHAHFYNFSSIKVGKFAMFAGGVTLSNGGHDKNTFIPFSGEMIIGNGVWIGTGAKIVGANITVGDNAIIGANALVISDVPAGAIVVGVPARIIGQRNLPEKVWHLGNTYFCPHTFRIIEERS